MKTRGKQEINKSHWTSSAVIYQIYPLSFNYVAGSLSDPFKGCYGNLKGITEKISYIESLGVDAVWLCPFFDSPLQTGFGYNITNYRDIAPCFGTLDDFDEMLDGFHRRNIKVVIDQVYSHTDITHPWFQASRDPAHPEHEKYRDFYVWYPAEKIQFSGGQAVAPNNWRCIMAMVESAWEWDRGRHSFYLHSFDQRMPDLNLNNPAVRREIVDIAKFWLDRGVDGFRLDAVCHYGFDAEFRDNPLTHPDQPFHLIHNPQRQIYDVNQPTGRVMLEDLENLTHDYGPMARKSLSVRWRDGLARMASYLNKGTHKGAKNKEENIVRDKGTYERLTPSFIGEYNFDKGPDAALQGVSLVGNPDGPCGCFYTAALRDGPHEGRGIESFRADVEEMLRISPGAQRINWAMSNHDMARVMTRWFGDEATQNHAKLCLSLLLSLPGSICLYQGEELGLDNPPLSSVKREGDDFRKYDPLNLSIDASFPWDAARTPMPWTGAGHEHMMWLKTPASHMSKTVHQQEMDHRSVLQHTREAIAFRRKNAALRDHGEMMFLETQRPEHMVFIRKSSLTGQCMLCAFNFTHEEFELKLPEDFRIVLANQLDQANQSNEHDQPNRILSALSSIFLEVKKI